MKNRKYEYRRNLPHYQKSERAHFVTFVTNERWTLPPTARDIALSSCLHFDEERMSIHAVVIMPDHVHMIFSALRDEEGNEYLFTDIVGAIKGYSAHSINKALGRTGTVWLDESFDHVLRCEENLEQKIEYVRQNPVRRGLTPSPQEYRWLWVKSARPRTAVPHGNR